MHAPLETPCVVAIWTNNSCVASGTFYPEYAVGADKAYLDSLNVQLVTKFIGQSAASHVNIFLEKCFRHFPPCISMLKMVAKSIN